MATPTASDRRTILLVALGVVVVAGLVVGGLVLLRGSEDPDTATTPETTTTERVPGPTAPLTGLEDPTGAVTERCAVSVKIGNTEDAHPQHGVLAADVVYEQVADGGVTRLLAVYQSQAPDRVGSVRSVRPTDQYVLWPLRGVFAFSGGNPYELASLAGVPVVQLDETTAGPLMFRGDDRAAPHNLYARVDEMYARCEDPPPSPLFGYRSLEAAAGTPTSAATVGFGRGYDVAWQWDAGRGEWLRTIFGRPDTDPDGTHVGVANVVVMEVRYVADPSGTTVEAEMIGTGRVSVLSDGKVVSGTWVREEKADAARLTSDSGEAIELTPGRTWVELLPAGRPFTTTPG